MKVGERLKPLCYLTNSINIKYDGDMVSVKGVFTQEANEEAEQIMTHKANILNVYGENVRMTTNEGVQTLYMLTKFDDI
jgi:DNA-directed RNA polymerase beta' subunit